MIKIKKALSISSVFWFKKIVAIQKFFNPNFQIINLVIFSN